MRREGLLTGRVWNKNSSNCSGRCGLAKCSICHELPVSKALSKTKDRKKWRSLHRRLSVEVQSVDDDLQLRPPSASCPRHAKVAVSPDHPLYECDVDVYSNLDTFWDPVLPSSGHDKVVVCEAVNQVNQTVLNEEDDDCSGGTLASKNDGEVTNNFEDNTNDFDDHQKDGDYDHSTKAANVQDKSTDGSVIYHNELGLFPPDDQRKDVSDGDYDHNIEAVLKPSANLHAKGAGDRVPRYKDVLFLETLYSVLDGQHQDVSGRGYDLSKLSTNLQDDREKILASLHSALDDQQKDVSNVECAHNTNAVLNSSADLQDKSTADKTSSYHDLELCLERWHSVPDDPWQLCGSSNDDDEADNVETMAMVSRSAASSSDWCYITSENTDYVSVLDTDEWCLC